MDAKTRQVAQALRQYSATNASVPALSGLSPSAETGMYCEEVWLRLPYTVSHNVELNCRRCLRLGRFHPLEYRFGLGDLHAGSQPAPACVIPRHRRKLVLRVSQLLVHLGGNAGHDRAEHDRRAAHALHGHQQRLGAGGDLRLILRLKRRPRRSCVEQAVALAHNAHRRLACRREIQPFVRRRRRIHRLVHCRNLCVTLSTQRRGVAWQLIAAALLEKPLGAVQQVAQVVGKVGVDGREELGLAEVAVLAKCARLDKVVPHRVRAKALYQLDGVQRVAHGLAHLQAVLGEEAMSVDAARHRQPRAHEHGGPVHNVEAQDVLAH
mmetsp:Transcript_4617/g.14183  ORF Transcript_4617/g.14183 Transcript_4617/m.14183 type:complete len:323 (-) Transcript_4617:848-1816(-)